MKKVQHSPSKRYQTAIALVDKNKTYSLAEGIELIKQTATVKFDSSVEIHFRLTIDPRKGDQQVRSTVSLPHGTGRTVRVAVIANDADKQKAAKDAGAELVGDQDLINDIKSGKIDFDVLVATPDTMKLLAPIAKMLGPKGLMPNPKDGTVTTNVAEAVSSLKKGKVSFKNDDSANLHFAIGKVSFTTEQLTDNARAAIDSIVKAKPAAVKGAYIKTVNLASSMGPGVTISMS